MDLDDLLVSARKGKVVVRDGKGNTYREVPLNTEVREAQKAWLQERQRRFPRNNYLDEFRSLCKELSSSLATLYDDLQRLLKS